MEEKAAILRIHLIHISEFGNFKFFLPAKQIGRKIYGGLALFYQRREKNESKLPLSSRNTLNI